MVKVKTVNPTIVNSTTVSELDWKTKTKRKTFDGRPVQLELDLYQRTPGGLTAEESRSHCKKGKK